MVRLDLSDEEARALQDVLRSYVGDLEFEIGKTDGLAYREDLRRKKETLRAVLRRIEPVPA